MKPIDRWIKEDLPALKKIPREEIDSLVFFRDPIRPHIIDKGFFFSPVDGVILYQQEVDADEEIINVKGKKVTTKGLMEDEGYSARSLVIGIFLTQYDVHIARLPFSGFVNYRRLNKIETMNRPMIENEKDVLEGLYDTKDMAYQYLNERFIDTVNCNDVGYKYHLVTVADSDVDVIAHFYDPGHFNMQNSKIMSIRFGSFCAMILPLPMPWKYELLVPDFYHVEAGQDALVKIIDGGIKVEKAWQLKSGKWHDYDDSGNIIEVPSPKQEKSGIGDEKIKHFESVPTARPIEDVGLSIGDDLPDNVFLHGSKKESGDFEIDQTKTLYATKNWDVAEMYAHGDEDRIKAFQIKEGSNIIDLNTDEGKEKLADVLMSVDPEMDKQELLESFNEMDLKELGISDNVDYANALYEMNIHGIKDVKGNLDITNNSCVETYIPEKYKK